MARILIVDDEEMDRMLGRSLLEDEGHELLYAPNGEVALRTYQSQDVDLVVTDLAMPNLNGLLLIEQIMQQDSRALVIAVSGVSPEQLERAEALGAKVTLAKPYRPEELLAAINETLASTYVPPPTDLWK